ncbi:MAG: EF-hand domain-containing protein [Alphaproteobacteria bacterium]
MNKRWKIAGAAAVAAGVLAVAAGAIADGGHGRWSARGDDARPTHARAEGGMMQTEMFGARSSYFATLDADKDGRLTDEEYRAGMRREMEQMVDRRLGQRFASYDANGDGAVTADEWLTPPRAPGDGHGPRRGMEPREGMTGPHGGMGPHGGAGMHDDDDRGPRDGTGPRGPAGR